MAGVWRPRRLAASEKGTCRELWEEIFAEDSKGFLDYYDKWKYAENECFGIFDGDRLVSMVQLNPYEMRIKGSVPEASERDSKGGSGGDGRPWFQTVESCYIIAVATREEYRHRGMMAALLRESLGRMRKKGMAFTFLMPAAEAIYRPFGFRYFYESNVGMLKLCGTDETADRIELSVRPAVPSDSSELAAFAEEVQSELFDCYTKRDCKYYEMLLEELASEGGGLLLLTEPGEDGFGEAAGQNEELSEKNRKLLASVPYWGENAVEIREILCRPRDRERVLSALGRWFGGSRTGKRPEQVSMAGASFELEKKKPVIMGRIVDAISFLELFSADGPMELFLELSDELLEENCGVYRWSLSLRGSRAERIVLPEEQSLRAAEALPGAASETMKEDGSSTAGDTFRSQRLRMTAAELFSCLMGGAEPEGKLRKVKRCRTSYINEIV